MINLKIVEQTNSKVEKKMETNNEALAKPKLAHTQQPDSSSNPFSSNQLRYYKLPQFLLNKLNQRKK